MQKPNVIIIMTDDQGYGDLSCMGSNDFKTPNIDAMANDGVLFTSMYSASSVCSPSRASLLTGRYPGNAGVRAILAGHRRASGLTPQVPTIATALKKLGYSTGICGKWHLGLKEECRPNSNGFDEFSGFLAGCLDYYSHIFYYGMADGNTNPTHDLWENETEVYSNGEYLTERITRKSVEFIRKHHNEPFMLYVAYNAPHYPMHAPEKYLKRFENLPWDKQIMAAMISAVDDGVGEIRKELESQGILDNTIIYFQSDNGPSRESRNWLDGTEDAYKEYKSFAHRCEKCELIDQCTESQAHQKLITRHIWEEYLELADDYRYTPKYKALYERRKETIERVFADAKEKHAMRYTQYRGLAQVSNWVRLKFAAMNLKKYAIHRWNMTHRYCCFSLFNLFFTPYKNFNPAF